MARTRHTARKSTGGYAPSQINETNYSLLSSEETSYEKKMRLELIKSVLQIQGLLRHIYTFSGENSILMIDKKMYNEMRKYVLILNLSNRRSQLYYKNQHFKNKIESLVKCKRMQLILDLSNSDFRGYRTESREVSDKEMLIIDNLYHLNLFNQSLIETVNDLSNCFSLNLMNCSKLTNVSMLSKLDSLDLTGCYKITDVSMLGHIRNLNLEGCSGIKDFSKLGSVHCLNLSSTSIKDTRGLENVHTLILIKCIHLRVLSSNHNNINLRLDNNMHIKNVANLKNVRCLILRSLSIVAVDQLCNVSFLSISLCLNLTEIKGLENVKLLCIYLLPKLRRIDASNNHEMFMINDKYKCSMYLKHKFKNYTVIMDRQDNYDSIKCLKKKLEIFKVLNRDSFEEQL